NNGDCVRLSLHAVVEVLAEYLPENCDLHSRKKPDSPWFGGRKARALKILVKLVDFFVYSMVGSLVHSLALLIDQGGIEASRQVSSNAGHAAECVVVRLASRHVQHQIKTVYAGRTEIGSRYARIKQGKARHTRL